MTSVASDRISKVTVEVFDPSGVFSVVSGLLQAHLPLQNLHWKSQNRPLRSIEFLHVDLVPSKANFWQSLGPSQSTSITENAQRTSIVPAAKERRHQIPGLRQTPYLKLLLLRCDDVENYRESGRKLTREWLKANVSTQSSSSGNEQENHDACEWMILHVVFPDTAAANQPRYSGSASRKDDEPSGKSSGSKLLGRSSNTILEKIKADFNVSSKSAPDRVAQIRLHPSDIPHEQLPPRKVTEGAYTESPQERLNAWNDLVAKFKTLILASFDLRVRQYEEDIKERGAQRSLPGWNFCTFFVLKEGLARGFESVGLLDDALLGYDELAFELDSLLRDERDSVDHNAFLETTPEFKDYLTESVQSNEDSPIWNAANKPIDAQRKEYRELILNNNISVFDFKCYIFSRQIALLHRMGIPHASEVAKIQSDHPSAGQKAPHEENEDLSYLAILCQRAAAFITTVSRILRNELKKLVDTTSLENIEPLIDNIVLSWTFAVIAQMLEETTTISLSVILSNTEKSIQSPPSPNKQKTRHPQRSSSILGRSNLKPSHEQIPEDSKIVFDSLRSAAVSSLATDTSVVSSYDHEELAARRADLILIQRRVLEKLGSRCQWSCGLIALRKSLSQTNEDLDEVDLDNKAENDTQSEEHEGDEKPTFKPLSGIYHDYLRQSISSESQFKSSYETLTSMALNHYLSANRFKAAEELIADLAILKFDRGDFVGAATLLSRVTPLYAERQFHLIEESLLKRQAQCLKALHRRDDYIHIILRLLEKSVDRHRSSSRLKLDRSSADALTSDALHRLTHVTDSELLNELLQYSEEMPYEVVVSMTTIFDNISVDPYIYHFSDRDGFQMRINFNHLLDEPVEIKSAKLRLKSVDGDTKQEILLTSENLKIHRGSCCIKVSTNTTTSGLFVADHLSLQARKVLFVIKSSTELNANAQVDTETHPFQLDLRNQVLCFPSNESLFVSINSCRNVHLDKPRRLDLKIESGRNDIAKAEIRLRSASAGLRIRIADTQLIRPTGTNVKFGTQTAPGIMTLENFPQHTSIVLGVPYSMERDSPGIQLRLDVTYQTSVGDFAFATVKNVAVALPIEVNVRDFFKSKFIRSTFNMKPAGATPLNILDVSLSDTGIFKVLSSSCETTAMLVFPNQSAQKSYKIQKRDGLEESRSRRQPIKEESPLLLSIRYQRLDERLISSIRSQFLRDLRETMFIDISRLLINELEVQLHRWLSPQIFSKCILFKQVFCPNYSEMEWHPLLSRLPTTLRNKLRLFLEEWHTRNRVLPLDLTTSLEELDKDDESLNRLDITVPVPRLAILHTASLSLSRSNPDILFTGSLINATLTIRHTRCWEAPEALRPVIKDPNGPLEFIFELDAPPDTWLIAGQRRTRFTAKEDEVLTWTVLLMPLKSGQLFLPSVEIRPIGKATEQLGCDTFYESMGERVAVINNVGTTTVALQNTPVGIEPLLLEVQGRT